MGIKRMAPAPQALRDIQPKFKQPWTIPEHDIISLPKDEFSMLRLEDILIIGAGTSSCVPHVACLAEETPRCTVCMDAVGLLDRSVEYTARYGGPSLGSTSPSRNKRTNPSAILRYRHREGGVRSVLFDCGKSFYSNTNTMLEAGVRELDGVVLTHGHADAILGLDDLRHWSGAHPTIQPTVEVWCDQETFEVVKGVFPYLVDPKRATGGGAVSALHFNIFAPGDIITVGDLQIQTIKLVHGAHFDGRPYHANGFICEGLTYLSDLSSLPPESMAVLQSAPNDILVVDCLFENRPYPSHYGWPQAKELHTLLRPRLSILVGMSHHSDYYQFQRRIDKEFGFALNPTGVIEKLEYAKGRVLVGFDGMLLRISSD